MDRTLVKALCIIFMINFLVVWIYRLIFGSSFYMLPEELGSKHAFFLDPIFKWVPGIVAIWFSYKENLAIKMFKIPNLTDLSAGLLGFLLPFCAVILSLPFGSLNTIELSFSRVNLLFIILSYNLLFALGEEILWRGYFYSKTSHWSYLKQSLISGFIWGLWHLPLICIGYNFPNHPFLGICLMIMLTMGITPAFLYYRLKSNSLFAPTLLHGTFNTFNVFFLSFFSHPNLLIGGSGFTGAFVIWVSFFLYLKKLRHSPYVIYCS